MSATLKNPSPSSTASKPLWAAVGVLAVAVLAMGATLIHIQTQPEEPSLAVLSPTPSAPFEAVTPAPGSAAALAAPSDGAKVLTPKRTLAPANHAPTATKSVANRSERDTGTNASARDPEGRVSRPFCANCGTVESVTPIQRDGSGSGGGAIAGGVLGAVVGNQVGAGNGKTLATILGAVGGGFAGNTVEKKMKKETVYEVRVRMEDGSTHTVEQSTSATVGTKVRVEGNSLQSASR
ncbi:glycine zipper 2TM domain-containing protein [Rhodoferax ferrireducens]|uniref:glycine zipper 2TM domain-containing protein n=1 Tax=Rhodoferax ferrireducens TaxID=192843 RepID=UPI000E0DCB7B|nr:glycine zipper 2TM domain-containing protein [Rhodoferax ferrireducens]